jgi:hypothetical protein
LASRFWAEYICYETDVDEHTLDRA